MNFIEKKLLRQVFLFLLSLCCSLEADSFSLSSSIKTCSDQDHAITTLDWYNDRGTHLLIAGFYREALNDFNIVLFQAKQYEPEDKIIGRALWGRAWTYAFLGETDALMEDLREISKLIGLDEDCHCEHLANHASINNQIRFAINHDQPVFVLCDNFCENTIDNMATFMKAMCSVLRDPGAKVTLYLFIDGLRNKAIRCCKVGGFWRDCVDPMVKIAEKWKSFGIPADPVWD
jgi:hypothetical protein